MKSIAQIYDQAFPTPVNRGGEVYTAVIGDVLSESNAVIESAEDFNCGALSNELEYARHMCDYIVGSIVVDVAIGFELDTVINQYVDLGRRSSIESDEAYRNRFKCLVVQGAHPKRQTIGSITEALRYILGDLVTFEIREPFDVQSQYFEVRVVGVPAVIETLFAIESEDTGAIEQDAIAGTGVAMVGGAAEIVLNQLLQRIKPAGVTAEVVIIVNEELSIQSNMEVEL